MPTHKKTMNRFAKGPATATKAISRRGFLRFCQVIGTGLAQPNIKPPREKRMAGTIIVPIGSICFRGFKVKRPNNLAVGSPHFEATQPCAVSWTVIAKSKGITQSIIFWPKEKPPNIFYPISCLNLEYIPLLDKWTNRFIQYFTKKLSI